MNIFPILRAKKFFPALSCTTSHRFLATCQNLEKTNDAIPRKCQDRQTDGQILFYKTFPATAGAPIKSIGEYEKACSIFLNFKKAFDSANYGILLSELEYYGVRGIPFKWFKLYL